jgi:hypothetical protein
MSGVTPDRSGVSGAFGHASRPIPTGRKQDGGTRPFSIRLTPAERASLEQRAGQQPLGTYVRCVLLGDGAKKRRAFRKPPVDDLKVAALLSELGRSRLSSNLNQLAKSANMGTLDVDDDIRLQLQQACVAIVAMREALLIALRMNPRG